MAKSRRNRGTTSHRREPLAAKQVKPPSDPALAALRQTKILPVIKDLCSADPKARSAAASAVANIVHDAPCRKLLLREQIVHTLLTQTLTDTALESRAAGWGILQLLAQQEEADFCIHLFRLDIVTALSHAAKTTLSSFTDVDKPFVSRPKAEQAYVISIAASLLSLMTALAEAGDDILDAISSDQHLCSLLFFLVTPSPLSTQEAILNLRSDALACLMMLCEDNVSMAAYIASGSDGCFDVLMALKSEDHSDNVLACAVLHNIFDSARDAQSPTDADDSILIPTLTKAISAVTPTSASSNGSSGWSSLVEQQLLALETLASIATSFACSMDSSAPHQQEDLDMGDADNVDGAGDEMNQDEMAADMEAVTGPDADAQGIDDLPVLRALLHTALPALTRIASMKPMDEDAAKLRRYALESLNNLAWSLSVVDYSQESNSGIQTAWTPLAISLWEQLVSPLLAADTADLSLATLLTSLSWALARALQGKTPLKGDEHSRFITLYHATKSLPREHHTAQDDDPFQDIGVKCVGLLGQLALDPAPLQRNREIGVFLITLVASLPDAPTAVVVEALNQLFDIYADDSRPCDVEVFWKDGFLAQLEAALPKVRAMARLVDKKAQPELRHRADEAVLNLDRFLAYKRKHKP